MECIDEIFNPQNNGLLGLIFWSGLGFLWGRGLAKALNKSTEEFLDYGRTSSLYTLPIILAAAIVPFCWPILTGAPIKQVLTFLSTAGGAVYQEAKEFRRFNKEYGPFLERVKELREEDYWKRRRGKPT